MPDHYEILGVPKNADIADIKKAYKKKALELHPDRNGNNKETTDQFKKVTEAYAILSDVKSRRMYDTGANQHTPFPFNNVNDILSSFFKHASGFGAESVGVGGIDVETSISISLKESIYGCQKVIDIPGTRVPCQTCSGSRCKPNTSKMVCTVCVGRGKVLNSSHRGPRIVHCSDCGGHGDKPIAPCPSCSGTGEEVQKKILTINIPGGVDNGTMLRLAQMGAPGINMPPGDLFVRIQILDDPKFKRNGMDLITQHEISLCKALGGGEEQIELLDGSIRSFTIPRPVKPGTTIVVINNAGVRIGARSGNLHIMLQVRLPEIASPRSMKLLEELESDKSFSN